MMNNNHSDFDPYAPDDDFRFDKPVQPPFDWQPAHVQTQQPAQPAGYQPGAGTPGAGAPEAAAFRTAAESGGAPQQPDSPADPTGAQQPFPPAWDPAAAPAAEPPVYTYSPNQAEGQLFEEAVATPVRPAESLRRPQIPPRPDFERPSRAPAGAADGAVGAVKRILDDLVDVIRPLFQNDPLSAAKKAGQKSQLFIWVIIFSLTVILGIFRHTNVYLRALLNGSLWLVYLHNFLNILLTCGLPVGFAFMLKAAHQVRLKLHNLLNLVAVSLLPVLLISLLNLLLGFIGSAAMLRFLISPLASVAWLMHYLLFRRALRSEKAGQMPAFEWMMLGYALVRFIAVAGFAA